MNEEERLKKEEEQTKEFAKKWFSKGFYYGNDNMVDLNSKIYRKKMN